MKNLSYEFKKRFFLRKAEYILKLIYLKILISYFKIKKLIFLITINIKFNFKLNLSQV